MNETGRIIFNDTELTFSEVLAGLKEKGYWNDLLSIDRIMIERHRCPKCDANLVYRGLSNPIEYKAFGVCEDCDHARLFWTEKTILRNAKKGLSARQGKA